MRRFWRLALILATVLALCAVCAGTAMAADTADTEEPITNPEEPVTDPEEPIADPEEPIADPTSEPHEEPYEVISGDWYYTVDGDTCTITMYTGSATELTIPSEIDGLAVTAIGNSSFASCTSLVSVTIPDGVTSIGYGVFSGCSSLTFITIPDDVTSIGDFAFSGC
ncbi:MAG: leucine-rich repeat domain-containing protein, partial [Clostridia bacterium]|nr:leucine-rich repeat domain-containing protein [Clostridia bacterium]